MLSPHNKGLFKRVISQSGVAVCPWAVNKNPRALAEKIAEKVNCPTDDTMMACLRMTDSATLTLAGTLDSQGSAATPIVLNLVLAGVVDGDFLPDDPSKLFHNAADIDYIAGVNDMDGHLFTGMDIPSVNQPLKDTPVEDLKTLLGALTKDKGPAAVDSAFKLYTMNWGNRPNKETIKKTVVEIETDYIFVVPTQVALYLHAANAKSARTYSYLLSEPSRMAGLVKPYPSWMGADHADDLQYVFGKPFTTPLGYWPSYRDLSGYMIGYWTNFAQTGNPSKGETKVPVTWPAFTTFGHQYLEIHSNMNKNYVKQKLKMRHVHWWSSVYPSLPSVKTSQ